MKVESLKLIYFSPTGTTKRTLNAIAKGISCKKQTVLDITSSIIRNEEVPKIDEDLVLIGMPVYVERIPNVAYNYLLELHGNNKPVVLIAVYGNIDFGISLLELKDISRRVNLQVIAAAAFIGEHSFSNEENPIAQNRPDKLDIQKAEKFGRKVKKLLCNTPAVEHLVEPKITGTLPLIARITSQTSVRRFTYPPMIDKDLCTNCGICVESCPVAAIDPNDLHIDEHKCLRCFACVKKCNMNARKIEYRKKFLVKIFLNRKRKEPTVFI